MATDLVIEQSELLTDSSIFLEYVRSDVLEKIQFLALPANTVHREQSVSTKGEYGDIFKGTYAHPLRGSITVALKQLRITLPVEFRVVRISFIQKGF